MSDPNKPIVAKVTVTDADGKLLRIVTVDGEYLRAAAAYPHDMLGQCIVEALAENFVIKELQ